METYAPHEEILLAQNAHLACSLVIATQLTPAMRRAYLLGDALGVGHVVGAQLCGCTEAAFRQRLRRARRTVGERIREAVDAAPVAASGELQDMAEELDRLVQLGDLARVRATSADAAAVGRAVAFAAPTLMDA